MAHYGKKKVARPAGITANQEEIDAFIKKTRSAIGEKEADYRRRSLALHPWVCAKCGRSFNESNIHLLTVHHEDGNHGNNPPDGSNWENLCIYCHEDEHSRGVLADYVSETLSSEITTNGNDANFNRPSQGFGTLAAALNKRLEKKQE